MIDRVTASLSLHRESLTADLIGEFQIVFEGVAYRSRTPILHLARVLAMQGKRGTVVVRRRGVAAVYFDIEGAAQLTVIENDKEGPRFIRYRGERIAELLVTKESECARGAAKPRSRRTLT